MMTLLQRTTGLLIVTSAFCFLLQGAAQAQSPQIEWWYDLDAPSFGSSAVGDIDDDGKLEIVFGTYFNDEHIYALNAEDGSLLWKYDSGGCNDATPVIADVDLDGEFEVILPASSTCRVFCFDGATGAVEWSSSTGGNCLDSPPGVADMDNDGKPEIVFGAFYGYVYCLNGEDGSEEWRVNLGTNSYIQTGPNILDLDGDGALDLVVGQWQGDMRVYGLKGSDGSTLWYSDAPTDWMYHGGSFADVDEDGKMEIAIGCYDGNVYLLNAEDGSTEWTYHGSIYIGAPTSIADLDNDGHLEIVFVDYNKVGALSHTGTPQWTYSTGGNVFRGAAIADIDGNGTLDVAFGCDDGILRAVKGDSGQLLWQYDLENHYGNTLEMGNAPVIADFDGDSKLDIFIVGGYGTSSPPTNNHGRGYMLSAGDGTGPGWLKFRHDLFNSGCFGYDADPEPDVKVDGDDGPLTIPSTQTVDLTISLDPGSGEGVAHDWWIGALKGSGDLFRWTYAGGWKFCPGGVPLRAYSGPLVPVTDYVIHQGTIPAGSWWIVFAVDESDNQYEGTYSDLIEVTSY